MKSADAGALYQRLADKLTEDIRSGLIVVGAQLPTQRDLAAEIGTTVGTIGRAYTLLQERGLICREVGRGTYVAGAAASSDTQSVSLPDKAMLIARIESLELQIAELRALIENS